MTYDLKLLSGASLLFFQRTMDCRWRMALCPLQLARSGLRERQPALAFIMDAAGAGETRLLRSPGQRLLVGRCYNATMRVELLTIGAELLSGAVVNTNAAYLSRRLAEIGLPCERHVSVSDDRRSLTTALAEALSRTDLVLTTGGLGPTFDDVTVEMIAQVAHRSLIAHPPTAARIRRFYTQRHRRLQRAALRQAQIPQGAEVLPNALGTAPGIWLRLGDRVVVALPGVPAEMRTMMESSVIPRLRRCPAVRSTETLTLRTAGLVELSIEAMLRRIRIPSGLQIGLYPHLRTVDVRLTATASSARAAHRLVLAVATPLRRALGDALYATGATTLEEIIGALLVKQRMTVGIAESCTGGLISDRLTNVPGSSRYLRGSVVAYANDVKTSCLGVPNGILQRFGAVSTPVARAMAQRIRRVTGAALGLSVTGIAGPDGGTSRKPVGLVCFGLAGPRDTQSRRCRFFGDRLSIKAQAAQTALNWLRLHLMIMTTRRATISLPR